MCFDPEFTSAPTDLTPVTATPIALETFKDFSFVNASLLQGQK